MKFLFVDTETTGTDKAKHGLIQMAGALYKDAVLVDQFNLRCSTFPSDLIEDEALAVNGRTREEIATYPAPQETYRQFTSILSKSIEKYERQDKAFFVAYNGDFDADMMRAWFEKNGDKYFGSFFWWPIIDVAKLAGFRLMSVRHTLPDFKLMTVAERLGVDLAGEAHDAMFDVKVTMRMFRILTKDLGLFSFQTAQQQQVKDRL